MHTQQFRSVGWPSLRHPTTHDLGMLITVHGAHAPQMAESTIRRATIHRDIGCRLSKCLPVACVHFFGRCTVSTDIRRFVLPHDRRYSKGQ